MNDEQKPKPEPDSHDNEDSTTLEPAVRDLEEAVTAYLRRATETFDLSKNVEVCHTNDQQYIFISSNIEFSRQTSSYVIK